MIDALLLTAAVAAGPVDRPVSQPNQWRDSGHLVWDGTPRWIRDVGECIRRHESWNIGMYTAIYSGPVSSTASGAYQFLDSTWQGNAKWAKFNGEFVARGYARAYQAPPWVQDTVFIHSVKNGGLKAWRGTGCPGTE